jgi:hypothetical protein
MNSEKTAKASNWPVISLAGFIVRAKVKDEYADKMLSIMLGDLRSSEQFIKES